MDLTGKAAVVTGAAMGIGRAIALRLAAEGVSVLVTDINEEEGRVTVADAASRNASAAFACVDASAETDVRSAFEQARHRFGSLDIVVNNAGFAGASPFLEAKIADWRRVVDVTLVGAMLGTYLAVQDMKNHRGGSVINISSRAGVGLQPYDHADYAACKAGMNRLTAALAGLADTHGIRVNCVCPDWVDTPAVRADWASAKATGQMDEMPDRLVPAERIADVVVDLLRDDALAGRIMNCPHDGEWGLLPQS